MTKLRNPIGTSTRYLRWQSSDGTTTAHFLPCTMSPPSPHLATVTLLAILGTTGVHCLLGAAV